MAEAKTYTVTGDRRFRGHEPGDTFTAELSEAQEQRYVEAGRISVGGNNKAAPKAAKPKEPEAASGQE